MPITVAEKWDSREGTQGEGGSTDLRYIIRGTDDDTDAKSALVSGSLVAEVVRLSPSGQAASPRRNSYEFRYARVDSPIVAHRADWIGN